MRDIPSPIDSTVPARASGCVLGVKIYILAAGMSSRMGKQNKLLTPWRGKPLLLHSVTAVLGACKEPPCIITGHQSDQIKNCLSRHLSLPAMEILFNPEYDQGMATSVRLAIDNADQRNTNAALIMLGDMPLISREAIIALIKASSSGTQMVIGTHNGKPGHPVIWPKRYFSQFSKLDGDRGAKLLLRQFWHDAIKVEIGEGALRDFDHPDAFIES